MSPAASPNRAVLERIARRLGPLLDEVVFVGGQVAELLVTDRAAVRIRATDDVDIVVPGKLSRCWTLYSWSWLRTVWRSLARALVRASLLACVNCGITMAAKIPRMMTTIRISTKVKPLFLMMLLRDFVRELSKEAYVPPLLQDEASRQVVSAY